VKEVDRAGATDVASGWVNSKSALVGQNYVGVDITNGVWGFRASPTRR
jgi:hypothetical protein